MTNQRGRDVRCWRSVAVLGLVVVAGCSADKRPATPPLPRPTRALVAWSNTVCKNTKSIDALRTKINSVNGDAVGPHSATSYINDMIFGIDGVTQALKTTAPSGIKAADAYTVGLVSTLNGIRPKLPKQGDFPEGTPSGPRQAALARQVAGVIATIKPQAPLLTSMVNANRELVASYNLAPECVPVKQHGTSVPSRALVVWSDKLCDGTKFIHGLQEGPSGLFSDLGPVQDVAYFNSAARILKDIDNELVSAGPTGIKPANDYRASLISAIRRALPKLPKYPIASPDDFTKARANRMARTLATVKPQGPDLPSIAAHSPTLAAAYNLAPNCDPHA